MALALTRVDIDATLAAQDRGGPARTKENLFAFITSDTLERHIIDISGDNITITDTNGDVLDDAVVAHPTLAILFIASTDGNLRAKAYDPGTKAVGATIATVAHGVGTSNALCTNADGTIVFVGGGTSPFIRSVTFDGSAFGAMVSPAAGRFPAGITTRKGSGQLAFDPVTNRLAAALGTNDNGVMVWPSMTTTTFTVPYQPAVNVDAFGVCFAPGGGYLYVAIDNDPFVVRYVENGSSLASPASPTTVSPGAGSAECLLVDSLGTSLIVGGFAGDGSKALWGYTIDVAAGTYSARIDAVNPPVDVTGMALTTDMTRLVLWGSDEDIYLYSTNLSLGGGSSGVNRIPSIATLSSIARGY
jgi:hypothetical protein